MPISRVDSFGAPGKGAPRAVAGNVVRRNIFAYWGGPPGAHVMLGSQDVWSSGFLKPNGSDSNLFWSPTEDAHVGARFPGGKSLKQWQGHERPPTGQVTCGSLPGAGGI